MNRCLPCSACCRLQVELICGVDDVPEDLTEVVREDGVELHVMRRKPDGYCVALRNGSCSIYNRRPVECVEFEFGGERCNELR